MSNAQVGWFAAAILLCMAVAEAISLVRWRRESVRRTEAMTASLARKGERPYDYVITITDWGSSFDATDMRWRWVIWAKTKESVPVELGNSESPSTAWLEVLQAVERHSAWIHPDTVVWFVPTMSVEWKRLAG